MRNPDDSHGIDSSKRVLMVAFHFPPLAGSSGIQRTLRFVQHLPAHGWQPVVLSAHARAYATTSDDLMASIPPQTPVERALVLDAARHLSIRGRYPGFLARPDRWRSWALGAVPAGLRLIRRWRPDVIWSTYPIATAHLIAARLHRLTGIPWVADFRDPMVQDGYPSDPKTFRSFEHVERDVMRHAARIVCVAPSTQALYRERYPSLAPERFALIENGYDEESFAAAQRGLDPAALNAGVLTLLHSGIVYPSERDPSALFQALGRMKRAGRIGAGLLRMRFRAPVHIELLQGLASKLQIEDLIEILPAIPYQDALQEMLRADGLLVMQGANCNAQVPVKLYEYLRAGRPILGLADPAGDTAKVMLAAGVRHVAPLEDSQAVQSALEAFLAQPREAGPRHATPPSIQALSRSARAHALADLFESVREQRRVELAPAANS